jgi:hypothetical protein
MPDEPKIPPEFANRIEKVIHTFSDENDLDDEDVVEFVTDVIFIYEEFIRDRLIKAGLA